MATRGRPSRLLGCLAAAYVFLEPSGASASASTAPPRAVAPAAVSTVADQNCRQGTLPPSRAAARGTLPDTGGGRSLPPLFAAAGLLVGGVAFRVAAARLRRREVAS